MKRSSYEQFAIVHADSASLFNEQLNAEVYRLRDYHPVVKFSESIPFYAQIKYTLKHDVPQSISDEYEMIGASFTCAQCPCFVPVLKDDRTEDLRFKAGDCSYVGNELGRTLRRSPACDHLYELIKEGKVNLCFTD